MICFEISSDETIKIPVLTRKTGKKKPKNKDYAYCSG